MAGENVSLRLFKMIVDLYEKKFALLLELCSGKLLFKVWEQEADRPCSDNQGNDSGKRQPAFPGLLDGFGPVN